MSVRSMTGHGCGTAAAHGVAVTVEISAVNRKNLDLVLQLPRGLQAIESDIQDQIRAAASRGRITVRVSVEWSGDARRQSVRLDEELAAAYRDVLSAAAKRLGIPDDVGMRALIQLPDVLHVAEPSEDIDRVREVVKRALRKAIKDWNVMRRREGMALQEDVLSRFNHLESHVEAIRKRSSQMAPLHRQRLMERMQAAGAAELFDQDRIIREVALVVDRADVTEELTRLDSHVKQGRRMLRAKQATGRSLDFLAQELLREVNTVGSKANDTPVLQRVVELKAEVERIREQVQNIE